MRLQSFPSTRQPLQPIDVRQHLTDLRRSQLGTSKFVGAVKELSESQSKTLNTFLESNSECIAGQQVNPRFRDACERLLSRYLELARRRNMTIEPVENCIPVFQELAKELRHNCVTFKLPPERLVTATLLSEQPLGDLSEDKRLAPFFRRFRGLVARAVTSNPSDPHGYLHDLYSRFSTCETQEARHEVLPLTAPTLLFVAKTSRDLAPLERLALFRAELKSLLEAKEFQPLFELFLKDSARSRFLESLLIRLKAKKCRPFLNETARLYQEIADDSSFSKLLPRRADILVAVLRHGDKAKAFLTGMLAQEVRITELAQRCGEPLTAKDIRVLCLRTPLKAHNMEAQLREKCPRNAG